MKNRWINLLVALLVVMIAGLVWHLFVYAKTTAAASLILNILKPLNILLFTVLFYIISRSLIKLYLGRLRRTPGFRLRTKLVLAILPLTLVPALIIFFLATRFLDRLLVSIGPEANIAEVTANAEALNHDYLDQIGRLYVAHGQQLETLLAENPEAIETYLTRFHIDGLEVRRDGRVRARYLGREFSPSQISRLEETAVLEASSGPSRYDDGFLIMRYDYPLENGSMTFFHTQETPFTERFFFISDSYQFLRHTQRKSAKVREINYGILLITTLAVIFGGIWTGLAFARPFINAFQELITGASRVSRGDFSTQIQLRTGDEIEDVVDAFNAMTIQLKNNREDLERHAEDLESVNTALSGQIQYNQTILEQIKAGVVSTDLHGRIQTFNPAAQAMLGLSENQIHQSLQPWLVGSQKTALADLWQAHADKNFTARFAQIEILDPQGENQLVLAVSIVPLIEDHVRFGSLLVLEDLTPLLSAQKVAAWREVAKRVAHEIKNPLTPIQLSIQRVQRKAKNNAKDLADAISSAYETIMGETQLLKNLVDEFSTFAKLPTPVKTPTDMAELVKNVCETYSKMYPKREFRTEIRDPKTMLHCDRSQLRQVLSNLINNSAQATEDGDSIAVRLFSDPDSVRLEVADNGRGIPTDERTKIFLPYYSKSPKGTGLGLAIVARIVRDHGGKIEVLDEPPKGTCFKMTFPTSA